MSFRSVKKQYMAALYAPIREVIFATVTVLYCERLTWKEHFSDLDQTFVT